MLLKTIIADLDLKSAVVADNLTADITGAYVSDMLSDVMAHAKPGHLWVTLQIHPNIIAVASLKELAGIVLVNSRQPEPETLQKAEQEGIPILISSLPAFELAGKLYRLFGG